VSKVFALRSMAALLVVVGCGTGVARADAFDFTFGVKGSAYGFETFDLASDTSVHCTSGCAAGTYVNYLPSGHEIEFGSIYDTKGEPFADYSLPSSFFTLGSHSNGMYSMNIVEEVDPVQTPEPSTFSLLGIGVLGVAGAARRRLFAR
jgi:hypothetical protein